MRSEKDGNGPGPATSAGKGAGAPSNGNGGNRLALSYVMLGKGADVGTFARSRRATCAQGGFAS